MGKTPGPQGWTGFRVEDVYGARIGTVVDVLADPEATGVGSLWLLVKVGRFETRQALIPVDDAVSAPGHIWVPYERELVNAAPVAVFGETIGRERLNALRAHYGLSASESGAGAGTLVPASSAGQDVRRRA